MGELTLAYGARTYSSGVVGRAICNARQHYWVADDSGGEAVGAGEMFLGGLSACAVNMVERIAKTEGKALSWMDVKSEAYRDMSKPAGDLTLYDAVRITFDMWGVNDDDAKYLVKTWKQR
ncbi:MAG: putative OsmC-like protein [Gammaproteobacteria bacterium]|jgi:uncharacterized OsmC-like protein